MMLGEILELAGKVLPFLIALAESIGKIAGSTGEEKKAGVVNAATSIISGWVAVSKGGQAETAQAVKDALTKPVTPDGKDIIDNAVALFFPKEDSIVNQTPSK